MPKSRKTPCKKNQVRNRKTGRCRRRKTPKCGSRGRLKTPRIEYCKKACTKNQVRDRQTGRCRRRKTPVASRRRKTPRRRTKTETETETDTETETETEIETETEDDDDGEGTFNLRRSNSRRKSPVPSRKSRKDEKVASVVIKTSQSTQVSEEDLIKSIQKGDVKKSDIKIIDVAPEDSPMKVVQVKSQSEILDQKFKNADVKNLITPMKKEKDVIETVGSEIVGLKLFEDDETKEDDGEEKESKIAKDQVELKEVKYATTGTQMGRAATTTTGTQMGRAATATTGTQMDRVATATTGTQMGRAATATTGTQMDRASTATTGTQMDRASTASAGTQTVRRATATGSPLVVKLDEDGKFVGIEGQLQIDPTTGKPVYDEYASIVESRDLPPPPATWGQTIRRGLGFSVPQPIKQTVTQTQTPFQQSELESLGIRESDFQSAPPMAARPTTIRNPGTQTGRVVFATPRRASTVPPDSAVPNPPAARRGLF